MLQPKKEYKTGGSLGTIWTGPANENPGVVKAKADKAKAEANLAKYKKKSDSQKAKAIEKAKTPNTKVTIKPKFTLFAQANEANNRLMDLPTSYPAKAKDSADYIHGFNLGIKGVKLTDKNGQKYESNEFSRKGQWEGQNSEHAFKNKDAAIIAKKIGK